MTAAAESTASTPATSLISSRSRKLRQAAFAYLHVGILYESAVLVMARQGLLSPERGPVWLWLVVGAAIVGAVFFGGVVRLGDNPLSLAYTVFPIVVWASLRFGPPGAAAINAAVAGLSVWATVRGHGPFVALAQGIVAAQVFVAVAIVTSLFLGAATARRQRAEEGLRASREQLSEVQRVARVGG